MSDKWYEYNVDPETGRPEFYEWGQWLMISGLRKNQAAEVLSKSKVKPNKHETDAFWTGYAGM